MTSIGTLFAFVDRLRRRADAAGRSVPKRSGRSRCRSGRSSRSSASCRASYLMLSLPVITWVRFLVWLNIGMRHLLVLRPHAQPARGPRGERAPQRRRRSWRTSSRCSATCSLFNGFCMHLLALLTEWGVTNEELAKWSELDGLTERFIGLHINPENADTFGLKILIAGRGGAGDRPCRRAVVQIAAQSGGFKETQGRPAGSGACPGRAGWRLSSFSSLSHRRRHRRLHRSSRDGTLWDSFYMTIISVTTVGYHEVHQMSRAGKLFTMLVLHGRRRHRLLHVVHRHGAASSKEGCRRGWGAEGVSACSTSSRDTSSSAVLAAWARIVAERVPQTGRTVRRHRAQAERDAGSCGPRLSRRRGRCEPRRRARRAWASSGRVASSRRSSTDAENVYTVLTARVLRPDLFIIAEPKPRTRNEAGAGGRRSRDFALSDRRHPDGADGASSGGRRFHADRHELGKPGSVGMEQVRDRRRAVR